MEQQQPEHAAEGDSCWLPGELFLRLGGSPFKAHNHGGSPGRPRSPLKSPLKCGGGARRLSTASRRLSTASARSLPESHPVSPCSDRGDASSDGAAASSSPRQQPSAQRGSGGIPAFPEGASSAADAALPAAEERVMLNLFVQDGSAAAEREVARLQGELAALRLHVQELEAAAPAAEQPAAAAAAQPGQPERELPAEAVQLVLNIADQQQPATGAAPQQQAQPPSVAPVQLVLNIVEQAVAAPGEAMAPAALAAQLQRAEACREELARQAGQLRGRIAKLEGAVQAGEGRVRAQAAELEAFKARAWALEAQLEAAQAQVGVTPERARAERRRLAEQAEQAEAEAQAAQLRVQRLEAVLAFEARQRDELSEFAAAEHQLLTSAEVSLAAEAAQWKAEAAAAAAQLGEARQRLVDTDAALLQRDEEVKQLREELERAQGAAAKAEELTAEWRGRAEAFDRDRQAAASNIRKAERELEAVATDNERLFRQLNFVRARLIGQLHNLDAAVPDIGKLARELQSWCDRESAQRARPRPA